MFNLICPFRPAYRLYCLRLIDKIPLKPRNSNKKLRQLQLFSTKNRRRKRFEPFTNVPSLILQVLPSLNFLSSNLLFDGQGCSSVDLLLSAVKSD